VLPVAAEDTFTEPAIPVLDTVIVDPLVATCQPAFWNTDAMSVRSALV
jgi:hypothetical protein